MLKKGSIFFLFFHWLSCWVLPCFTVGYKDEYAPTEIDLKLASSIDHLLVHSASAYSESAVNVALKNKVSLNKSFNNPLD